MGYSVFVDGIEYKEDRLANIRVSKRLEGKGFDGVSTSCFSCEIYDAGYIENEGAEVRFSGVAGREFEVTERSEKENVTSITA
ncbi:MAG: hypothetical protein NC078_11505, partial [Ruminococcus sp.]|nr:hypothetical protein [Ruminococcus sp.]